MKQQGGALFIITAPKGTTVDQPITDNPDYPY